ncbi:uncharacterized protein LOC6557160 [Drosophila grimshawi]|uniref:GH16484 n=1 Tax=Drosophila grimshawi TaxID=7222 RepID=B4J0J2_DROGR|nr:uncharacterized protein LOC6557160 [Drosophila grimshawi]EDV96828.1 GH16484 [Drosophila grimshawi]
MSQHHSRGTSTINAKLRHSRVGQAFFTLKRPQVFQVRKSLVEYVDDELFGMNTSVFYQRIFILSKNVELKRESLVNPTVTEQRPSVTTASIVDGETATLRTAEVIFNDGDEQHYSQQSTEDGLPGNEGVDEADLPTKIADPIDPDLETLTRTFRFDEEAASTESEEEEYRKTEQVAPAPPKDIFAQFTDKLLALHKDCRELSYTPDPMCGIVVYMNEYTMMMLESGEDLMGIFCNKLLAIVDEFWQSNRVFLIEDHIKELYTKELVFRRIPAVFLNEKFPPSTPTDEYLMGKEHLIIKDKMCNICALIRDSLEPSHPAERATAHLSSMLQTELTSTNEFEQGDSDDEDGHSLRLNQSTSKAALLTRGVSEILPPEIFRRLLPEVQRIELVLSADRFYYTLEDFANLYGKVPFRPDDDGNFWPIQNNYVPPNIFKRTPFDINLTFADYAAEMKKRMQEEQEKAKADQEASDAYAAAQLQPTADRTERTSTHPRSEDADNE